MPLRRMTCQANVIGKAHRHERVQSSIFKRFEAGRLIERRNSDRTVLYKYCLCIRSVEVALTPKASHGVPLDSSASPSMSIIHPG